MDSSFNQGPTQVLRAPTLKRGKPEERISDRVKLEKVLGVTVANNAALDCDRNTGTVAYPAGCTVVLFNTITEQQNHIINSSKKSVTSLAFSSCGRYIVTGECGHQPAVRVWDLQSDPQSTHPGLVPQPQQVAEFLSHKYGINCVAFSPSNKYVVSIGTQHDMIVNVWDWKNNVKVASNKVSTKVKAIAFAENGSYFVTVGNRLVKFWYLEYGKAKYKEAVPLMGRSAILGEQRNNYFCDVACGKGACGDSAFAITRSGLLCEFNNRRLLDKWVELRTTSANCLVVGENYIFVGCAEGIIRCFNPETLRFITTLPRTHYLGVDVSLGTSIAHMASPPPDAKYPDAIAITYDEQNHKLTSVYNDHSVYVWDVYNIKRVGKSFSFLYHSACIWGVEIAPPDSPLPPGSFLTCSSDDTIRVWALDKMNEKSSKGMYKQNIYSNELVKVVYVDKEMAYLKDLDLSGTTNTNEKQESSYDGRNGVRAIRISPDGKHLASGDRSGNVRIHETTGMKEIVRIEAHDAEVLCLEYSGPDSEQKVLASASRDRLIHIFDMNTNYSFLQTLDDHSSSITAVRFLQSHGNLQMVSCGADKSLIFRSLQEMPNGTTQFARGHNVTGKTTLYDMEVDAGQKHVITACQDRQVRIYSVNSGKHTKSFRGSAGTDGTLIKVVLDRSGIYLATSCTDKSLSVYDYYSGECMATMCGHSELVTGLRFTNDCNRLISASGDGCIFVWRIPHDMVITMRARLSQQAVRQGRQLDTEVFTDGSNFDFYDGNANVDDDYKFSVGQLPLWAKKHISDDTSPPSSFTKGIAMPKGRWAQRAEKSAGVKSIYADSVIPFPSLHDRRADSDGSKDSSIDSGTEVRHYSESRRENLIKVSSTSVNLRESRRTHLTDDSALGSLRDPDESTAHDADIDSDQEYRHQPLYYPTQIDSASGSEFTVTNIDVEELRRSMRRSKRGNLPAISIQTTSVSGSQDSDDDDDEASTPSGENTDRNPLSMLSVSSESLDQIVNREKFLQSTFESLSGAEQSAAVANKSSISSQFLTRLGGNRNDSVINAVKQTKNDPEAMKKREELNRRIADTKKKLQSVGRSSPLKYSQSIHDISTLPDHNKWNSPNRKQGNDSPQTYLQLGDGCFCVSSDPTNTHPSKNTNNTNFRDSTIPFSASVPSDLCYMRDFIKNTSQLSQLFTRASLVANEKTYLSEIVRPRKLKLDKTLNKYKTHKSLPVSPVNEERSFLDYVQDKERKSFSYFIDFDKKDGAENDLKQVCSDIEKFTQNFQAESCKKDESFSSDSLEDDNSFASVGVKKAKKKHAPRRCVSNNEISSYQMEFDAPMPKSESFFLKNSQESILSDDLDEFGGSRNKSYCTSLESILSNESDCKSAPLEVLFSTQRKTQYSELTKTYYESCAMEFPSNVYGGSLPKDYSRMKTSETQTDLSFEVVPRRSATSSDFKEKLLKFESAIAQNDKKHEKGIAFFVKTDANARRSKKSNDNVENEGLQVKNNVTVLGNKEMYIPTLETKNKQYKSKFCNVLNNKPEINLDVFEKSGNSSFELTNVNFEKNTNLNQQTSSLDRHLFSKSLLSAERVCHKPPKAVRRHSSKSKRPKTSYEYVKKSDFLNNRLHPKISNDSIEFNFKEKNVEKDLDAANSTQGGSKILHELYDSLDKEFNSSKIEHDSLEINLNNEISENYAFDSLEVDSKNVWSRNSDKNEDKLANRSNLEEIQFALENIRILNEIQRKINKINNLVDVFNKNMHTGRVKQLSSMYESMTSSQSYFNDLNTLNSTRIKYRRRNLSLPSFVERRLNFEANIKRTDPVQIEPESPDSSLRRSCSLSDLSFQGPVVQKRKIEQVSGKLTKNASSSRVSSSRYSKSNSSAMITRSSSTGVLNQSDSETETTEKKFQSRLMRPTISSQNKVNSNGKGLQNRKRQSHSTMNLSTIGHDDLSSSDEGEKVKPIVPPRMRLSQDISAPKRHQAAKDKTKLSTQLCKDVAVQLIRSADNVVDLYRRLTDTGAATPDIPVSQKDDTVRDLETSIDRTLKMLQDVTFERLKRNNKSVDINILSTVKKLNDLVSKGQSNDPARVVTMMQQYSDILISMMQQKIQNSNNI